MQVDPIKPTLKAPGIWLLKLHYDEPHSDFAFKIKLCRYTEVRMEEIRRAESSMHGPGTPPSKAGPYTRPIFSSTCAVCFGIGGALRGCFGVV